MQQDLNSIYKASARQIIIGADIEGVVKWQSPSNIALIKYWGKHGLQLPLNPSLSLTLSESYTETEVVYKSKEVKGFRFDFIFDGVKKESFSPKLNMFFKNIEIYFPFIKYLDFSIKSSNTFPHSSGIASSASGMSALALCICSIEKQLFNNFENDDEFFQKASFIARLGSGSASRSVYGGIVSWGNNSILENSSDLFATEINRKVHPEFLNYKDSIILIDSREKKVSSSLGHSLMNYHTFADSRFKQASHNYVDMFNVLKTGNLERFIEIVEDEAMSLHAMMMTSKPSYFLMLPESISVIMKVKKFRDDTSIPLCFTMDAGPNIHLLYPEKYSSFVIDFINSEISNSFVNQNTIFDSLGKGPKHIK